MKYRYLILFGAFILSPGNAAVIPEPDLNNFLNPYELGFLFSGDSCRSGWTCHTVPTTCDQSIAAGDAWGTINQANSVICLEPGDHSSKGDLQLTANGTQSSDPKDCTTYKWLVRGVSSSVDIDQDPWDLSSPDRVDMTGIDIDGDCWIIAGINFQGTNRCLRGSGEDVIVYRNELEGSGMGSGIDQIVVENGWTVQRNLIYDCDPQDDADNAGISINQRSDVYMTNNEIYNCSDGVISGGDGGDKNTDRMRIVNNDIYMTTDRDIACDDQTPYTLGVSPPGNTCTCSENGLDIKAGATTSANFIVIEQNRLWHWLPGSQDTSPGCGGTGSTVGSALVINRSMDFAYVRNNIIVDSQRAIGGGNGDVGAPNHNITFEGNIIADGVQYYTAYDVEGFFLNANADEALIWGNTVDCRLC